MFNVDMQIISYPPNGKKEWLDKAIESLKDEPVNLKIYEGNSWGPLHNRQALIEKCDVPFFGWVDHDDEVVPGTVQKCVDFLSLEENKKFCGVYTDFTVMNEMSETIGFVEHPPYSEKHLFTKGKRPFHFILFRTEAAKHTLKIPSKYHGAIGADLLLMRCYATLFGDWVHLPINGYKWRSYENSCGKKINEYNMVISHCNYVIKNKDKFR
jgi:hypothetical protein